MITDGDLRLSSRNFRFYRSTVDEKVPRFARLAAMLALIMQHVNRGRIYGLEKHSLLT